MANIQETARPPKDQRKLPIKSNREDLVIQPVTETQNQRNAGNSVVQSLLRKGYEKPEDPELLNASQDGISFNLVIPKAKHEEMTRKNNERARRMEGFREFQYAKSDTKEEAKHSGQEILEAMGVASEHDG